MTVSLILWFLLHPFHVGLIEIEYNPITETYQVSMKLFTDDLEKGLEKFSGLSLDITDSSYTEVSDSLMSVYIDQNFEIRSEDKINLEFIGSEREYDVTWIYLESDKINPQNVCQVTNEILLSVYSDQTHIVHFSLGEEIQSDLIHSGKTKVLFQH
ncbi:MAG: hypothetical protein ACJAQ4_000755 [Cryomorphaceae bacterium]|jgi:hypothetical protein